MGVARSGLWAPACSQTQKVAGTYGVENHFVEPIKE